MKTFAVSFVVCLNIFITFSSSAATDSISTSLQSLLKQRTDEYLKYTAIQVENTDSVKVIMANKLFETDNLLINKIVALDSTKQSQAKQIEFFEKRTALSKKGHFIARIAGSALFLIFLAFLILYFLSRKKFKIKENKLNTDLETNQHELIEKHKIITSAETKLNEALQKEILLNNLILDKKTELEESNKKYSEILLLNQEFSKETNELSEKNQQLLTDNKSYLEEKIELTNKIENLLKLNNEVNLQNTNLLAQKTTTENKLFALTEENKQNETTNENLFSDSLKHAAENKGLHLKIAELEVENAKGVAELKLMISEKNELLNKLYTIEDEHYDLKAKLPEHEIKAIKELVEENIETLKLAYLKIQTERDQLNKALRIREPEDILTIKINSLVEENYNLQLDLEDEKAYAEKLNEKLDKYLDELEKQDLELELLSMKMKDRTTPENRTKFDDMELNLVKIEKLNRLKEFNAITDEEYQQMKQNIITKL